MMILIVAIAIALSVILILAVLKIPISRGKLIFLLFIIGMLPYPSWSSNNFLLFIYAVIHFGIIAYMLAISNKRV